LRIISWIKNAITKLLFRFKYGSSIGELVLLNAKEVYCLGEGRGIGMVLKVAEAFKGTGSRVIGIIGSDSRGSMIMEEEMKKSCDELFITTRDGSYQRQGKVTDVLKDMLVAIEKSTHTEYPDLVFAAGGTEVLDEVSRLTQGCGIKTITREIAHVQ